MQGKLFAQSYREFFEIAIKYMLERKTYKQKISFSFSFVIKPHPKPSLI
jgi:hypothetical protein